MTARPLAQQNINIIHSMDFKSYVHSFDTPVGDDNKLLTWSKLVTRGTAISTLALVDKKHAGFAVWERGPKGKPGYIIRLGVLPVYRRRGVARTILSWVADDLRAAKKKIMRVVLSQTTCLGVDDPDDVSGFMKKVRFKWIETVPEAFFQYNKYEDGLMFERKL